MKRAQDNGGLPNGQAPKKRKQKDTPSRRRAREARRLARAASVSDLIEEASTDRQEVWAAGDSNEFVSHAFERELEKLFDYRNEQRKGQLPAYWGATSAVRPT